MDLKRMLNDLNKRCDERQITRFKKKVKRDYIILPGCRKFTEEHLEVIHLVTTLLGYKTRVVHNCYLHLESE